MNRENHRGACGPRDLAWRLIILIVRHRIGTTESLYHVTRTPWRRIGHAAHFGATRLFSWIACFDRNIVWRRCASSSSRRTRATSSVFGRDWRLRDVGSLHPRATPHEFTRTSKERLDPRAAASSWLPSCASIRFHVDPTRLSKDTSRLRCYSRFVLIRECIDECIDDRRDPYRNLSSFLIGVYW